MRTIFEQGSFNAYSQVRLDESRSPVLEHSQYGGNKTTVFISHKHDDLEDLKGVLGLHMGLEFTLIAKILQCLK